MTPDSTSSIKCKRCQFCRAYLPLSFYGTYAPSKDGHVPRCRECIQEYASFRWTKSYGRRRRQHIYDYIRNVSIQNSRLLDMHIADIRAPLQMIGFIPHTDKVFRISFGIFNFDMPSMAVYTEDGNSYFEMMYSISNVDTIKGKLMAYLKSEGIRLEQNVDSMELVKRMVYYIDPIKT